VSSTHRLDLAPRSSGAPSADPGLGAVIVSDVLGKIAKPADVRTQITEELNTDGELTFTLSIDHPLVTTDNFAVGKRELHWYRNGDLRWGGKLWRAEVDGRLVRFIGYGWFYDLRGREITDTYEQVRDQFLVVQDLIDYTQDQAHGNLGLDMYDRGGESGVIREVAWCDTERKVVADAITDLGQAEDGFDLAMTADKKLRLWSPRRGVATTVTYDGDTNTARIAYQRDATEVANELAMIGPTSQHNDCAVPAIYVTSDLDSQSDDEYGLRQHTEERSEIPGPRPP
jgi:hypothetical protein